MQLESGQPIGFMVIKISHGWSGEAKKEGRCNKCELVNNNNNILHLYSA